MPTSDNDRLRDFSVTRQIQVLRASESETRRLLALLSAADEELTTMLARVRNPGSVTRRRLEAIQRSIRDALDRQHDALNGSLRDSLGDVAGAEAEAAAGALRRVTVPVGLDTATPRLGAVVAAMRQRPFQGRRLNDWIRLYRRGDVERVQAAVLRGITIGQTTDELVSSVVGTERLRRRDGVREVSRRGLRTLVRTSMIHASTVGRSEAWEANRDLLEGELWVSTLDSRTSSICQALDGEVFDVGEGQHPPAHPNCRSVRTPVLKDEEALGLEPGTRASLDGQVPADLTYEQWLRGRSAAFQDEVLGPTKGALFRRGGLSLDRFVSDAGEPLTIPELRRAAPTAFREAGLDED